MRMSKQRSVATTSDRQRVVPHTRINEEGDIEKIYRFDHKLGSGSFGVVLEATHIETGKKWAIKIVNKEKAGSSAVMLLEREVAILKRVNHPNIIHLEEVFETSKKMYLVMELCSQGELSVLVKQKNGFPEEEAKIVMKRLAKAVAYLHKNDIVHRDIKLENILLSSDADNPEDKLSIKLTDFGLSVVKGGVGSDSMIQSMCGTPLYMAPEVIDNQGYSQQCDVWSVGILAYILISAEPPFSCPDEDSLYEAIRKGEIDFSTSQWKTISSEAKNAIQGLLKVDPAHRLTASEFLDHPWITGDKSRPVHDGPSNVLEMMKQWKDELLLEDNGDVDSNANVTNSVDNGEDKKVGSKAINSKNEKTAKPSRTAVERRSSLNSQGRKGSTLKPVPLGNAISSNGSHKGKLASPLKLQPKSKLTSASAVNRKVSPSRTAVQSAKPVSLKPHSPKGPSSVTPGELRKVKKKVPGNVSLAEQF